MMTPGGRAPELLLRAVVAVLPPERRDWGRAMRADLAHLDAGRWRFVASCLRAVVSPKSPRAVAGVTASAVAIGAVVALTARTAYLPLRWGLVGYVVLLVAVAWGGRLSSWAPVGRRPHRLRIGGLVLIAVLATQVVTGLATGGDAAGRASAGVPILAGASLCYLGGVFAMSAGPAAPAESVGAGIGFVAGIAWVARAFLFPPVPPGVGAALLVLLCAIVAAIVVHRTGRPDSWIRSAAAAAATGALVIDIAVGLVGAWAPTRFIPLLPTATVAWTPAARIAQSRTELGDPYVLVLALGAAAALLLVISRVRAAEPRRLGYARLATDELTSSG